MLFEVRLVLHPLLLFLRYIIFSLIFKNGIYVIGFYAKPQNRQKHVFQIRENAIPNFHINGIINDCKSQV